MYDFVFYELELQDWSFRQGEGVFFGRGVGGGGGARMEGMLVVYSLPWRRLILVWLGLFLTPKGKLFNDNHLPELDEKFGALLV